MRERGIARDGEHGLHAVTDEAQEQFNPETTDKRFSGRFKDDLTWSRSTNPNQRASCTIMR